MISTKEFAELLLEGVDCIGTQERHRHIICTTKGRENIHSIIGVQFRTENINKQEIKILLIISPCIGELYMHKIVLKS